MVSVFVLNYISLFHPLFRVYKSIQASVLFAIWRRRGHDSQGVAPLPLDCLSRISVYLPYLLYLLLDLESFPGNVVGMFALDAIMS